MNKPYDRPFISPQLGGLSNKFGHAPAPRVLTHLEGIPISRLISEYGSPLFVFSERQIKQKYREVMDAFSLRYPRVRHAWSFKTNYLRSICQSYRRLGSWAEVVSSMEYQMARDLGIPADQIIYNGPHKPYDSLKRALQEGALVNIDSMDELRDAEQISAELGRRVRVGLRFNMSLGSSMSWDRYGFNLESGEALEVIRKAVLGGRVSVVGFHAHIGTFVTDVERYRTASQKLVDLARVVRSEFGVRLEILDVGGGFASKNRLKGQYLSSADAVPSSAEYAESICAPILEGLPPDELPLLILESGRGMIDEAGSLIASVVSTKRMKSGRRSLVIDAGVNLLFTAFWYDHDITPAVDRGPSVEDSVIYGNMCMQIDVIRDQVRMPALVKGDPIVIQPAGAYNNTQWMQFIALRPNVVMIGEKGQVALIRSAETLEYLQRGESIPEWLSD